LNINNKISSLPSWRYIGYCSSSIGSDVCDAINLKNNVNNNKMIFSADDNALIKLLKQDKGYGAKRFIAKFPSKPWTLSWLNKLLQNIDTLRFGATSQKPL